MADEKDDAAAQAKKDREEAVKAQDNPPQPWPTQEQLDKQKAEGGPIDGDDGDAPEGESAAAKRKREADEKASQRNVAPEPGKPYQTR